MYKCGVWWPCWFANLSHFFLCKFTRTDETRNVWWQVLGPRQWFRAADTFCLQVFLTSKCFWIYIKSIKNLVYFIQVILFYTFSCICSHVLRRNNTISWKSSRQLIQRWTSPRPHKRQMIHVSRLFLTWHSRWHGSDSDCNDVDWLNLRIVEHFEVIGSDLFSIVICQIKFKLYESAVTIDICVLHVFACICTLPGQDQLRWWGRWLQHVNPSPKRGLGDTTAVSIPHSLWSESTNILTDHKGNMSYPVIPMLCLSSLDWPILTIAHGCSFAHMISIPMMILLHATEILSLSVT